MLNGWMIVIAEGVMERGRPHKTWDMVVRCDLKAKNISADNALDRRKWKKTIR